MSIVISVNGAQHRVQASPETPLLYVLRGDLGLNGAKYGCGLGQCGACTVHIDGKATFSCITPVAAVEGREIKTVEGLAPHGDMNALQRAFLAEQAAQCGYCIAGMIMRAQALLDKVPRPDDEQIRRHMQPNLCRCGTHMRIIRAIKRASGTSHRSIA
ncbi:(2Fe-2S)-binding protein [Sphingomonas abietis]|uniref:(2Fe-2S)-binding protein n=1 Tax=Sphingomonas abietis TaxID=3012344 RepID=A0ABY7NJS8_9SPHN|nr:(2Fe-2S)-binding protein [Sphingomonas abietis]WBO21790.1 (2Fe-2S)-binding protein [Sphingomonas abietis]